MRGIRYFFILFTFALLSCSEKHNEDKGLNSTAQTQPEHTLLQVGSHKFTEKDIQIRAQIIQIKYGPISQEEATFGAYSQLIQGYLLVEVLNLIGEPITDEEIKREIDRINKQTKVPELLEEIKSASGGEKNPKYAQIYIIPEYANNKYYFQIYQKLPVHNKTRQEARQALDKLLEGKINFEDIAKQDNRWKTSKMIYHQKYGLIRYEEKTRKEMGIRDRELEDVIEKLDEGQIHQDLVEKEGGVLIIKSEGQEEIEGESYKVIQILTLPKKPAEEYFWEKAQDIKVWIKDEGIRKKFKEKVSWAKSCNLVDNLQK